MDQSLDFDAAIAAVRRASALMAPTAADSITARIAKEAFRLSLIVAAAAVATVVLSTPSLTLEAS